MRTKLWSPILLSAALLAGCGGAPEKKPVATPPATPAPGAKTPECDCEGSGTDKSAAPAKSDAKSAEPKSEAVEKPKA